MGIPAPAILRLDFGSRVACIQSRLDHQYLLSRYLSTAKSTQQFFTLATEHTAADNFNPALTGKGVPHGWPLRTSVPRRDSVRSQIHVLNRLLRVLLTAEHTPFWAILV